MDAQDAQDKRGQGRRDAGGTHRRPEPVPPASRWPCLLCALGALGVKTPPEKSCLSCLSMFIFRGLRCPGGGDFYMDAQDAQDKKGQKGQGQRDAGGTHRRPKPVPPASRWPCLHCALGALGVKNSPEKSCPSCISMFIFRGLRCPGGGDFYMDAQDAQDKKRQKGQGQRDAGGTHRRPEPVAPASRWPCLLRALGALGVKTPPEKSCLSCLSMFIFRGLRCPGGGDFYMDAQDAQDKKGQKGQGQRDAGGTHRQPEPVAPPSRRPCLLCALCALVVKNSPEKSCPSCISMFNSPGPLRPPPRRGTGLPGFSAPSAPPAPGSRSPAPAPPRSPQRLPAGSRAAGGEG